MELLIEQLSQYGTLIEHYVDPIIILLFILGGFFSKKYLNDLPIHLKWLTLLTGTLLTLGYLLITYGSRDDSFWLKALISYAVATSLYEIIIQEVLKKLNKSNDKG